MYDHELGVKGFSGPRILDKNLAELQKFTFRNSLTGSTKRKSGCDESLKSTTLKYNFSFIINVSKK